MPHFVIYVRKSTESEDRQVLSLDSQIHELTDLGQKRGFVIRKVYSESKSAKAPGRPVFDEMLKAVTKEKGTGVLCWKLDRLARNPVDGAALIWALEQGRVASIVTPHRDFVNRGDDKFWMQIEFGMAKKYVDDLSDNVKRGNRAKLASGWRPGMAPVGYVNDPTTRTIIPDPERFMMVRKMWELMLTGGYSPADIAEMADSQWGFRTRRGKRSGDRPLSRSYLYELLGNPFYAGIIVHSGERYKGSHKPMVTFAEFDRVQRILGRQNRQRPQRHTFAYTGLIQCGECGCSVTAEEQINRYDSHYVYYRCTKKNRALRCAQPYVREEELEYQFVQFLESIWIGDSIRDWALKWMEKEQGKRLESRAAIARQVAESLSATKRQLESLTGLRLRELLTDGEFLQQKEKLVAEQVSLEQSLNKLGNQATSWLEPFRQTILFVNQGKNQFLAREREEKRAIISAVGSNLKLRERILLIEAKKPFIFFQRRTGIPVTWGLLDDVRTFFVQNGTSAFNVPDLAPLHVKKATGGKS